MSRRIVVNLSGETLKRVELLAKVKGLKMSQMVKMLTVEALGARHLMTMARKAKK
jgi:hypothetical protein